MDGSERLVTSAGWAAVAGGVLGLGSLVGVLAGEVARGEDFMSSPAAALAGWAGYAASALLVVGLTGFAVRYAAALAPAGRVALLLLGFATAMTVGASSTLALVVPTLADEAPALVDEPPAAVPPTFILTGLVMGVCAIVLAVGLRRAGAAAGSLTTILVVGAVVAMVPLPSRFFLLALAVGALCLARPPAAPAPASSTAVPAAI